MSGEIAEKYPHFSLSLIPTSNPNCTKNEHAKQCRFFLTSETEDIHFFHKSPANFQLISSRLMSNRTKIYAHVCDQMVRNSAFQTCRNTPREADCTLLMSFDFVTSVPCIPPLTQLLINSNKKRNKLVSVTRTFLDFPVCGAILEIQYYQALRLWPPPHVQFPWVSSLDFQNQ